jgi:DNA topoisomerase-1
MEVLNGRFGPYLAFNNLNYRLPKTVLNPADLTLEDCRNIVNTSEGKPARRTAAAKRSQAAAAKKTGTTIKKTTARKK